MGDELATRTEAESVSTDAIFDLLAHSRRRELLTCLQRHDEPLSVADVAEEIAVHERDDDIQAIPAEDIKRIYMSLYHNHIPKLEDHAVVTYDQDRDVIDLAENASILAPFADLTDEDTFG